MEPICPQCHVIVRPTDFFCYNCGKNLHPAPLPTTVEAQIALYIKSVILLPMGIIWGIRYLRQPDQKSKIVGLIAIVITVVISWIVIVSVMNIMNSVNAQLNSQLNTLQGF